MKRIIGTVVALAAVLGFSTVSSAAYITYNLTGATTYTTISSVGTIATPLGPGSFAAINTDANGDSVEGDVSLVGGSLNLASVVNLGTLGTLSPNTTTAMSGATGTISGGNILWTPLSLSLATTGTFQCTGAICGALGVDELDINGNPANYPIAIFNAFSASLGNVTVNPSSMGTWTMAADLSAITGSTNHVVGTNAGADTAYYNYAGPGTVPEPATLGLLLLGLGALSLRSRKA